MSQLCGQTGDFLHPGATNWHPFVSAGGLTLGLCDRPLAFTPHWQARAQSTIVMLVSGVLERFVPIVRVLVLILE